jgi:hypothetical protein
MLNDTLYFFVMCHEGRPYYYVFLYIYLQHIAPVIKQIKNSAASDRVLKAKA